MALSSNCYWTVYLQISVQVKSGPMVAMTTIERLRHLHPREVKNDGLIFVKHYYSSRNC